MLYTQLISFGSDEYASAVAKTLEEARKLVEAGFEYVSDIEEIIEHGFEHVCAVEDIKLFEKRK